MHKLEKLILESYAQLLTEMDGGRLFDYFKSKGYDITERRPDGYPPKEGVEGYIVSRGGDRYPQSVVFQYNKDTDEFTISRMSGYRIDQKEASKAGMRQAGRSGAAGMDSYMTDGNYNPVGISAEGLKDIVDHVMSGLDRESKAQSDFYKDRGHTSGTIDEQFKVGQKVTYLGHPAVITLVDKDNMDRVYYSVSYDKGNGKTKASNLYNKGGEIKALEEMAKADMEKEAGGRIIQWEDLTDKQRAGIVKRYGEPMFKGEHDFFNQAMDTYFKTYSKNKETGSIGHKIIKLPSFGSLYKNFSDIISDIRKLMGSDDVRKDEAAREFFEITKTNFRKLQRYLRTERPEQYRMLKMQRMMEGIESAFSKINERMDMNDPVAIKVRAARMKAQQAKKQAPKSRGISLEKAMDLRLKLQDLEDERADVLRNMEQEAEPEGGPIADDYGAILNDIDKKIDRIMSALRRYDMNENSNDEVHFGYDLDAIQAVVDYLKKKYEEGVDYELFTGRGDTHPNTLRIINPRLHNSAALNDLLNYAQSDEDRYDAYTDYEQRRREEDDYYEDPDYYKESKISLAESLLDDVKEEEEPKPEEEGDEEASKDTVLEDATDEILAKFPTLQAAIIKLQTEDFKEFVDSIDWISPRPTEFRINLKNGQDYIMKWTGTGFEAQIMGKRFYIDKINDYQQALDKLAILYKEGPMTGAGEGEPADVDSGGSSGGGGGDFPGVDAAGGGGEDDIDDLGGEEGGEEGGADLTGEPVDFEEPAEEPEA